MTDIKVDTYKLNQYAQRLSDVNSRINRLDGRLNSLYTQVGLLELWSLIQADALTGYSCRLLRCRAYLQQTASDFEAVEKQLAKQDPTDFSKPADISPVAELVYDVGVAVKKGAQKVKKAVTDTIERAADSYVNKGAVYKVVQYGKATMKAVSGIKKIAVGVTAIVGTGGLSTPIAILTIFSGMNDVYNSIMDATYIHVEDYDKIGTNALKDKMIESGGIVGDLLGNQELGEDIGELLYFGSDLVTSLATLDTNLQKSNALPKVKTAELKSEFTQMKNLKAAKLFNTDVSDLAETAKESYKATTNLVAQTKATMKVAESSYKVGKNVDKMYTVIIGEHENPVLDVFDTVSDIADKVGTGVKVSTKVTKFIFG